MKLASLLLAISVIVAPSMAEPAYTLTPSGNGSVLTITGAEIAVVRATQPGTADPVMLTPTPFWDSGVGFSVSPTDELAWSLVPGEYTVIAFGESVAPGVERTESVWQIAVAEPDRKARIRRVFVALFEGVAEWRELAPTDVELFQAIRGF